MYYKTVNGKVYKIMKSVRKNKKYDVYLDDKYITSYGDKRYQHFKDKFGLYSHLNHNDEKRRESYRKRHQNDYIDDPNYAGYWSYNYLW